ncbi:hypothetical protein ACIOFV_07665 [Streptomyces mirabilis]|uniref:hypothetical protein n=1 Tax=Streptomyces mirabilis TaxID=68239 RepID=UPI0037FA998E
MTGTAASMRLTEHGFVQLAAILDLQPTASGTWNDSGLQVTLPVAGTYEVDASVRAALSGTSPVNTFISARLWDVTAGAVVPGSEVILNQISLTPVAPAITSGLNVTGPIQVEYDVPGARVVRLQGRRVNATGASIGASILANTDGRTTLRFKRIA